MKKWIWTLLFVVPMLIACSDDDDCKKGSEGGDTKPPTDLVSPALYMSNNNQSAFTGILEVYPCKADTSIYVGNYRNGTLSYLYASYRVLNGITESSQYPVWLPVGPYNMVYWGVPTSTEPTYKDVASREPAVLINNDLSKLYRTLVRRQLPDTTYLPVYDYVFATQAIEIGTGKLNAILRRVTSAIDVTVSNEEDKPFETSFDSIWINIGGIANQLDYYTALPSGESRTVSFGLSPTDDRKQMVSNMVNLFPSGDQPLFQIFIALNNGKVKSYKQNLAQPLLAGNRLSLTLTVNGVLSNENEGTFEVTDWVEKSENIDLPPLP